MSRRGAGDQAPSAERPPSDEARQARSHLKGELRQLTRAFAHDLIALLDRYGVFDEDKPLKPPPKMETKRVRRTQDALDVVQGRILDDLRTRTEAVSIGMVARSLGLTSRQVAHPMRLLVENGVVLRSGERRGARYQLNKRKAAAKKRTRKRR